MVLWVLGGLLRNQVFGCRRAQPFAAFAYQRESVLNAAVGCYQRKLVSLRQVSTAFCFPRKHPVLNYSFDCLRKMVLNAHLLKQRVSSPHEEGDREQLYH